MAKQLEQMDYCRVSHSARRIADAALVAYWMHSRPGDVNYHSKAMREEFAILCEIMGLRLVEADPAPMDRVMLASAAAMIPEEDML